MSYIHSILNCPFGSNCPRAYAHRSEFQHALNPWRQALMPASQGYQPTPALWWAMGLHINPFAPPFAFYQTQLAPVRSSVSIWENVVEPTDTFRFKVLSYNVLAQMLLEANMHAYANCRQENLMWETRSERIYNEVINHDADVLCFQEVQQTHIDFFSRFEEIGYVGVYKKKTGYKADGCATFIKESVFSLDDKVGVEYHHPTVGILAADNVGLIVKLVPKDAPSKPIVIANTHLVCHKFGEPSRIAQIRLLLNDIEKMSFIEDAHNKLPVILAGDLNASHESFVIKLLDEGQIYVPIKESLWQLGLPEQYLDHVYDVETGELRQLPLLEYTIVRHAFNFSSLYELEGDPSARKETVDYIFYTNDSLKPVERLARPSFRDRRAMPNEVFGSDHVCIAGTFELLE